MRKTDFEFKYLGGCAVCAVPFQARKATLLDRKAGIAHIYAQCAKCTSSASLYVIKNATGFVTTVGTLTDLTRQDMERVRARKPISTDDVLDLHKALEND